MGLFCGYFTAVAMLPVNRPSGTLFFGAYCARHSASLHAGLSTIAPPALVRFCRAGAGVPRVTSWYARAIAESERPGSRGGKSLGASADGALGPSYMNGARSHGVGTWRQKQRRGRGRGRGAMGAIRRSAPLGKAKVPTEMRPRTARPTVAATRPNQKAHGNGARYAGESKRPGIVIRISGAGARRFCLLSSRVFRGCNRGSEGGGPGRHGGRARSTGGRI